MQHRLTRAHDLLDSSTGALIEAGFANEYLLCYNKQAIKTPEKAREWEYFLALSDDFAVAVTLAGVGVGAMYTVHLMDFTEKRAFCRSLMKAGDLNMPPDITGDVSFTHPEGTCVCHKRGDRCEITFGMDDVGGEGDRISGSICFVTPGTDKMVLVVPYENPQLFYYNYKVCGMPVSGTVHHAGKRYTFAPDTAMGTQDWGRGLWEPVNQWYWGSASGVVDGKPFGFNIGHGFGDTAKATENMLFYDGVCHKLEQVAFQIPGDVIGDLRLVLPAENYLLPWKFTSGDGRLELDFRPLLDRASGQQRGEYNSTQHQVFGHFSGTAVLDDGRQIKINDLFGFAEKVGNDWRRL